MSRETLERLPLFPLNTVLFPEGLLPLRIFEPRYKQLLADITAKDAGRRFGVCLIRVGEEAGGIAVPFRTGTEAEIVSVRPAGATFSVLSQGRRRFEVVELHDSKPYAEATVRFLDPPTGNGSRIMEEDRKLVDDVLWAYHGFVSSLRRSGAELEEGQIDTLPRTGEGIDPLVLSYRLAAALPVDPKLQQILLEVPTAAERLRRELEILHRALVSMTDHEPRQAS